MIALELSAVIGRHGLLQAIKGLTLQIARNEVVALIGANGAGKTTLLRMIAGLHPLADGEIRLFGAPIGQMPAHARVKAGIALSPEGRRLFGELTVRENLQIACENGRRGDWTLDRVCAALPQIAPLLRRTAGGLSGGQRQRVLIARALACEPDLLLLDEPTASLDPTVQEDVHALLRDLNQRLGIIMVSHDLGFVSLYFKTVICVNRDIHVHATGDLTQERVARMYGREVRLLLHAEKAGGDR